MHDRGGRKGGAWHQGNGYLSPTRLRALRFPGSRRIVCVYSGVKERKVPRSGGALLGVSHGLRGYENMVRQPAVNTSRSYVYGYGD